MNENYSTKLATFRKFKQNKAINKARNSRTIDMFADQSKQLIEEAVQLTSR